MRTVAPPQQAWRFSLTTVGWTTAIVSGVAPLIAAALGGALDGPMFRPEVFPQALPTLLLMVVLVLVVGGMMGLCGVGVCVVMRGAWPSGGRPARVVLAVLAQGIVVALAFLHVQVVAEELASSVLLAVVASATPVVALTTALTFASSGSTTAAVTATSLDPVLWSRGEGEVGLLLALVGAASGAIGVRVAAAAELWISPRDAVGESLLTETASLFSLIISTVGWVVGLLIGRAMIASARPPADQPVRAFVLWSVCALALAAVAGSMVVLVVSTWAGGVVFGAGAQALVSVVGSALVIAVAVLRWRVVPNAGGREHRSSVAAPEAAGDTGDRAS